MSDLSRPGRHYFEVDVAGRERRCALHVPAAYSPAHPLPLVIVFHGGGANGTTYLTKNNWAALAEAETVFVACPDGLPARLEIPADFRTNPRIWNDGRLRPESPRAGIDDVAAVRAWLDLLERRLAIDPGRIFAAGHSNGGGMVFRLGAEMGERFAALAIFAGHCWLPDPHPARQIPTLHLIGDQDPLSPIPGGTISTPWGPMFSPSLDQTLETWARGLGAAERADIGERIPGVSFVHYCLPGGRPVLQAGLIAGQGHDWPGGAASGLPEFFVGPRACTIDATRLIWDFFKEEAE